MFRLQHLYFYLAFFASAHLNVTFLKEECEAKASWSRWMHTRLPLVSFLSVSRHLSHNSSQAWKRQGEGLWHQATQFCSRSVTTFLNFPSTWKALFMVWMKFYGEINVYVVGNKCINISYYYHYCWDLCCILQNQNIRNVQCHFNVKMVGPPVAM